MGGLRDRWIVIAAAGLLVALLLVGGCSAVTVRVPLGKRAPKPPIVIAEQRGPAVDDEAQPPIGSQPATSTYRPFIGPSHVKSVGWLNPRVDGEATPILNIQLDDAGAKALSTWTKSHVGHQMLLLVDQRVLMVGTVSEPIDNGAIEMDVGDQAVMKELLAGYDVFEL